MTRIMQLHFYARNMHINMLGAPPPKKMIKDLKNQLKEKKRKAIEK